MFGETFLYETPATDPAHLIGRTVDIRVPQLTNDKTKSHLKLVFRIDDVKEKNVSTHFWGLECSPEYIGRNIRAGLQKLEAIDTTDTKDGWKLQITTALILNRKSEVNIQKKSRQFVINFLKSEASKLTIDEFVKNIVAGVYQKKLKKDVSSVYPVRFLEIGKIEVMKTAGIAPAAS